MDQQKQEAVNLVVSELTSIKYELSLYVDEDLMDMGARLDKLLEVLISATETTATVDHK
jgi:hypothetical protein